MSENINSDIIDMISEEAAEIVNSTINQETGNPDIENIEKLIIKYTGKHIAIKDSKNIDDIIEDLQKIFTKHYNKQQKDCNDDNKFHLIEKHIALRAVDSLWMDHIDQMSNLREEVSLQGYGQRDPLQIYKQESYNMFVALLSQLQTNTVITLFRLTFEKEPEVKTQSQTNTTTNEGDIQSNTSSSKTFMGQQNSTTKSTTNVSTIGKVGRNDPCPCGSGKKYKKCCGRN
jgi:preprotein translocase subunit SecA